jgi:carbamoylphosphate synthase small subunit
MAVQHHPEASPGPEDSFPMFEKFVRLMKENARAS